MKEYDIIVIGGGPAGSTTAALVAESGKSVLVLERDVFPRFKIGESLMPGTYWTLQRLGIYNKMQASAFPKKFSVQFFGKSGKAGAPFYFKENEPEDRAQTWQVLRSDFDQLMIDNAVEKGAEARQEDPPGGAAEEIVEWTWRDPLIRGELAIVAREPYRTDFNLRRAHL